MWDKQDKEGNRRMTTPSIFDDIATELPARPRARAKRHSHGGTYMQTRVNTKVLAGSFAVLIVGNYLWLAFAISEGIYSMCVTGVLFGGMNAVSLYRWRKKNRSELA